MVRLIAVSAVAAAMALSVSAGSVAGTSELVLTASNGAVIEARPVSGMGCGELRNTLARIDSTGYRDRERVSAGDADFDLFVYEEAVAVAFFRRCTGQTLGHAGTAVSGSF